MAQYIRTGLERTPCINRTLMTVPRVSANAGFTVIPCFMCVMVKAFATKFIVILIFQKTENISV